jgi:hypothetical protein
MGPSPRCGGEPVRGVSDRAFAKARERLHMPALQWLNDWVLRQAEAGREQQVIELVA